MQILLDENGYISSFSLYGGIFENGIEVPNPEDEEAFKIEYASYKYENGELIFDSAKNDAEERLRRQEELREKREKICFPVVNRGGLWYDLLTENQKSEMLEWYMAWLDATETLVEPETPEWLKEML